MTRKECAQAKTRQVAPPRFTKLKLPASRGPSYFAWGCFRDFASSRAALLLLRLLAADRLQLGEHGVDIEVVARLLRLLRHLFLAGGLGGRQQRGAAVVRRHRLFLGRALHLEIELDLRAEAERHRVH